MTITDNLTTVEPRGKVITVITVTNRWDVKTVVGILYSPPISHEGAMYAIKQGVYGPSSPLKGGLDYSTSFSIDPGIALVVTYTATVNPTATGTVASVVSIKTDQGGFVDSDASNNTAVDTTSINPPATTKAVAATTTIGPVLSAATTTVNPTPTTTVMSTSAPATAAIPTVAVSTTLAPVSAPANVEGLQSPSGRTKCRLVENSVAGQAIRCTVTGSTAKLPRRPATCDFDWEDIAVNSTGRAYTVCAGDSIDANYPVLAYGQTWKRSVFTCTSAKSGITCRNPNKRGFRITKTKRTYL